MKSKKQNFVIYFLLIFINSSFAQATFQKTYGDTGDDVVYSIQQTFDGGYIMAGYTTSFVAGIYHDVYLVKTDLNGDTLWTKTYGGTLNDEAYCVQQTTDSGYILTGYTKIFGSGYDIIYLIKTDVNGNELWAKTYTPSDQFGSGGGGTSVKQTFDGGYIVGCGTAVNMGEILLIKTDASGDTLWTKYIAQGSIYSIEQTTDSGYIMFGSTLTAAVYLLKTDVSGNIIWKKSYGSNSSDIGYSVKQTSDGGYIAVGCENSFSGGVWLIKTDDFGDTLWTKAYGGDSIGGAGISIQITNDGGYIIAGFLQIVPGDGDVYLVRTDSVGDTLWTKTFSGNNSEGGLSVLQAHDGGFVVAGATDSFGAGNSDVYLIKTDANGNSGCYESGFETIVRTPPAIISIPVDTSIAVANTVVNSYSSIIGSGSTINTLCTSVGINEIIEDNLVSIYPNPASNNFTININAELFNTNIVIRNMLGEKIYSEKVKSSNEKINCEYFSSGIYFVAVTSGKKIITKKLIVNK